MTEGDIHHPAIGEMLQVFKFSFECQSVFDTEHDTLQSLVLVHPELVGGTGDRDIVFVPTDDLLNLIEDQVGIGLRTRNIEAHIIGELLPCLGLWQISHHDRGILTTLGHLLQINEDLRITLVEMDALGKEHRGVAMGVERQDTVVRMMGLAIGRSLSHQPLEQGQSCLQALGMPLHTKD